MWRRVRKDHLAQCTCARPDVEPIFVWRHTEPRHELAGNQAAPPAYIWLIGITASPYILTFSSHRVSQTCSRRILNVCPAEYGPRCPLWVTSRHSPTFGRCPL